MSLAKRTDADTHVWVEIIESSAAYNPHYFPVPDRGTCCGLLGSLSLMKSVPVVDPVSFGANSTWTVQLCPNPKLAGQLLVETMNSTVAVTAPTRIAAVFWLVMVTVIGALLVPTA